MIEKYKTLHLDEKDYTLYYVRGIVREVKTDTATIFKGVGSRDGVSINSTVNETKTIFIAMGDEKDEIVKVVNWDFDCRTGNYIAAMWVVAEGKSTNAVVKLKDLNGNDLNLKSAFVGLWNRNTDRICTSRPNISGLTATGIADQMGCVQVFGMFGLYTMLAGGVGYALSESPEVGMVFGLIAGSIYLYKKYLIRQKHIARINTMLDEVKTFLVSQQ